jgi:hypothetical protein
MYQTILPIAKQQRTSDMGWSSTHSIGSSRIAPSVAGGYQIEYNKFE